MNIHRGLGRLAVVLIGMIVLAMPSRAVAEECRQACGTVASTAVSEAKAALRSCKLQCRESADASECRASCRTAARQARTVVRTELAQCAVACRPQTPCEEQCLEPARECLAPIIEQARTCTHDCGDAASAAMAACASAADPFACLKQAASELYTCMQGCATTARDGAGACKATLLQCNQACSPGTPCEAQCAPALHECLVPVVSETGMCGRRCAYTAKFAALDCISQPDPAACLAAVAQQLGQCAISCRDTASQDVQLCRTTFDDCVNTCLPPDPCRDACHQQAQECAQPVITGAEDCGFQCATDALTSAASCLDAQDPMACLLEVEQALSVCARGCVQTLIERGDACRSDFRQCTTTCLDDGTCRGGCLAEAGQCLGTVSDDTRTCVRTCAEDGTARVMPCLSAPDPAACLAGIVRDVYECAVGCRPIAVDGAGACRAGLDTCVALCPADACQDTCVGSLEQCLGTLATDTEACANHCLIAAWEGGNQCLSSPNKIACFSQVAEQGALCGADCAANARVNGAVCWNDYSTCGDGCTAAPQ